MIDKHIKMIKLSNEEKYNFLALYGKEIIHNTQFGKNEGNNY